MRLCGHEVDRGIVEQLCRLRFFGGAGAEQPIDVLALAAGDAVEGENRRAITALSMVDLKCAAGHRVKAAAPEWIPALAVCVRANHR